MQIELLGIQLNIWGLYCAIGALCAVAAEWVICSNRGMKKGSEAILGFASLVFGLFCSRALYCLVTTITQVRMPISDWFRISDGGWSLFGMISGVMLAAWVAARISGEKPKRMLDAVSVALPLMIVAERMGEESLQPFFNETKDVFNLSRQVFSEGFLTTVNNGKIYFATYRIDAFLAMILFLILAFSLLKKRRRDGDLWILFMLLCGAGGVLGESLRKDQFLEYSFVRIQQVLSAIMLAAGIGVAGYRSRTERKWDYITALVTIILTVVECIGLEFIIDRTDAVHSTLYSIMIGALSIPVILGISLLGRNDSAGMAYPSVQSVAALSISSLELITILLEMGRIHYADVYMVMAVLPVAAIAVIHGITVGTAFRHKTAAGIRNNG